MDYNISLVDAHAIEETIRHVSETPHITYDEMVSKLSWYWKNHGVSDNKPKEWVLEWIKVLVD